MSINIAMIGCGSISGIYLHNITKTFKEIELIGVCDLIRERAGVRRCNVPKLCKTMYDAFADPDVDIVLNLTRPYQHLKSQKPHSVENRYTRKNRSASLDEGELVDSRGKRMMLGGAPDTAWGAGIQTKPT